MSTNSMETIEYKEVEFDVYFEYTPGEKEVRYYSDGSGHPGCPESIDIYEIKHKGVDFSELLTQEQVEEVEQLLWDLRESYEY